MTSLKMFRDVALEKYYGIQKDGNDDPICKTAKETQT